MTLPILRLLEQIRDKDPVAWPELDRLYRPLVLKWLRGKGISVADAEDISQEVLIHVLRLIDGFEHNGRVGAFRNWLRNITYNVMRNHLRKLASEESALTDHFRRTANALNVDTSEVAQTFNREHDRMIVERLLEELESDVSPQVMTAFRRYCLAEESAESVASDLGMSVNMVYVARFRVIQRLRARSDFLADIAWSDL